MAKKSKTQRAKASANRRAKKAAAAAAENMPVVEEEAPKKKFFARKKDASASKPAPKKSDSSKSQGKAQKRKTTKKPRIKFLADVRSEMRRVTWPTKQDVLQWSGVVIVALLFFGLFCVVLDDWVVTPILMAFSSLGA